MSSAAERKKAREAYLAALSQQRDNDTDNGGKGGGDAASQEKNVHGENSRSVAMSKREKMFEERRKQFYEKNQEPVVAQDQGRGEGARGGQVPGGGPVQVTLGGGSLEIQRRKQETHDISHEAGRAGNSSADRYPETDPEVRNQSTALGFGGRSEVDDKAIKREKQVEYARQLESQISPPPPHQIKSQQHHQHQQGRGDPSPFAGSEVDDKALKRAKQAEYASQLDLQINPPFQQQRQSHHHQQQPRGGQGGGYEFGGSEVDDKALKREKQAEYAKQLESQINPPPHHNYHQEQQGGRGGREGGYGDSNFGGPEVDDKAAKRAKQAEYARQLESQIKPPSHHHHHHQDQQHQQSHQQQQGGGTRYDSNPFGGSESDDKAAKRAKQAEYARQLESQMNPYQQPQQQLQPLHQQRDHNRQQQGRGGGPFGGSEVDDKAVKRAKQAEYARQLESQMNPPPHQQQQHQHQQYQQGGGGGRGYDPHPFGGSETDDKAAKRAKQAEYARQLESQMNPYQQPQQGGGGGYGGANHRAHQEDSSSASSAISEGWEMGPLGVPVRKTLAVGNRGVQKAYLQNHSPQKPFFPGAPAAAMGAMGAGYSRGEQLHEDYSHPHHHQHLHQQQQQPQAHLQQGDPLPLSHLAPASALGIMGQDEREARKIQLQLENARALEAQIRMKKENDERLKREEEEVERKFQEKLERERREMEVQFQKEQLKIKAEEERKESLRIQIEDKKKQKAEEDLRLKELEEKEDQRIRKEQEIIRQREEEEMRREKGPPHSHGKGNHSHSHSHGTDNLPSPLFRAPSPILNPEEAQTQAQAQQRKRSLFSPRKDSPPQLKGRAPPPLPVPVQESPTQPQPQHHRTRARTPPQRQLQRRQETETEGERQAESMDIQNHPVIERLREETALAIKEASQARKELAQLKSLVTEKEKKEQQKSQQQQQQARRRTSPRGRANHEVEASLDSKSVKTAFAEDWKDDESLLEPATLKAESRFVFPDGSSYQSKDKDNQQGGGLSSASVTTTPALSASAKGKGKPSLFAKHKPTGDSEHHQRLANDIIKYNSQLFSEPSPAPAPSSPVPLPAPVPAPVPATVAAHKPRPKSSSSSILGGDETIASTVHSPSGHRSRSSQELKRSSASSQQRQRIPQPQQQLSGSSSSATSQLTLSRGDKQRGTEREANDSEIGIDFDVDRAFRRNRRKWELLEGMAGDGALDGFQINGDEELSLLLGGLNSVSSSRPTTSGTIASRPPSQHPQARLGRYPQQDPSPSPYGAGPAHSIRRSNSSSLIQSAGRAAVGESRSLSSLLYRNGDPQSDEGQQQLSSPCPLPEPIDYSAYGF